MGLDLVRIRHQIWDSQGILGTVLLFIKKLDTRVF